MNGFFTLQLGNKVFNFLFVGGSREKIEVLS